MQWWAAHLLLLAIVAACFSPWWAGDRNLAPGDIVTDLLLPWRAAKEIHQVHNHFVSDAVTQYLPYRLLAERSFREDGYIGWNPYTFGGSSLNANTMGTFSDWTVQLHRWLPFWSAWHGGLMAQFFIAGAGMLHMLRSRRLFVWAAFAGAVCYMMNFQFVAWTYHRWALGSFCWAPWMLWALFEWKRLGGGPRFAAAAGFLALGFLGGSLQHSAFLVLVVGCVWAGWMLDAPQTHSGRIHLTFRLAIFGIAAICLAAFSLVPCTEAFLASRQLGETRGGFGYLEGPLQPVLNFLSYPFYAFPFALGSPSGIDFWKLFKSDMFNLPR